MNDTCICENTPTVWRLTGVTRTLRLRIFNPDGTPLDLTGRTVAVTIARDNSEFSYAPGFVIEGDDNNVVKFEWPADKQGAGDYTINVTTTDGSGNVDRVNWHGPTGIRLVDFSFMVRGEDALGVTSEANIGLDGTFTMNGTGMSAYDEWLAEGHTGTPEEFIAWLRQPATDAASAAEAQMGQIQERADGDHTRAGNDHTTAGQDHTRAGNDHTTATDDHRIAAADHSTATDDHTLAASDHATAEADHTQAASDHTQASSDHTTAEADHGIAASDHTAAAADHTQAGSDHSRAESDHTTAASDHSQAGTDHTRAEGDHATAGQDHTQAGSDHTTAAGDHTTAAADHTQAVADHAVMAGYDTRLGDVEDEVSQLGQELIGGFSPIDLSGLTRYNGVINAGKWAGTTSSDYKHIFLPVVPGEQYKVTTQSSAVCQIAAMSQQDLTPSNGDTPSYTPGFGVTEISNNTSIFIQIPTGCAYLYVLTMWSSGDRTPTVEKVIAGALDTTYEDKIGGISDVYLGACPFLKGIINKDSKLWAGTTATNYTHIYWPVSPGEVYRITAKNNVAARFAPFTQIELSPSNGDTPAYVTGYSLLSIDAGNSLDFVIPGGCSYLYITSESGGTLMLPDIERIKVGSIEKNIEELSGQATDIDGRMMNSYFTGDGNNYVSHKIIGLKPGYRYRVVLRSNTWDITGITGVEINILDILSFAGNVRTALVEKAIRTQGVFPSLDDYYEFTVPSDSDYIRIGGRAAEGVKVYFMIAYNSLVPIVENSFNSQLHSGLVDWATPCRRFASLMKGDTVNDVAAVDKCDAFLFFTDPHTQARTQSWVDHFGEYMAQIQKVYNSTPTEFVLCGGDWLGNSDTPDEAVFKLGLVAKTCYTMLPKCYLLVGNHDTNYQGKKDSESASGTTRLPNESLNNLWYYWNKDKAYFTIESRNTKFYCFDTGTEGQLLTTFDDYGYEQATWFANSLLSESFGHIAVALHIYYQSTGGAIQPLAQLIMQIAAVYNDRGSITIDSQTFNFSAATGRVEFAIAGHQHADAVYSYTYGNDTIPVIVTLDTGNATSFPDNASFDLVFVDYDNRKITCVRVGSGSDREIGLDAE